MGIDVTAELLTRIIDITGAKREQDNIPIIINHNPQIPDRTQAIVHGKGDPLPSLKSSVEVLTKAGVDFIAIPCNTAHYYYDRIQENCPVPIIHIIKEAAKACLTIKPSVESVGLLASTGTVNTGLYQSEFTARRVQLICPNQEDQTLVMNNIMRIKSREDLSSISKDFVRIARELISRNAEIILIGCTDISLALKDVDLDVPVVDALSALASKVVDLASSASR